MKALEGVKVLDLTHAYNTILYDPAGGQWCRCH